MKNPATTIAYTASIGKDSVDCGSVEIVGSCGGGKVGLGGGLCVGSGGGEGGGL